MKKSNEQQKLKLIENISYIHVSTMPAIGWVAKFSNIDQPLTLIGWATIKDCSQLPPNGFWGNGIVGLVNIDGNIVPCTLIETFEDYLEITSTPNTVRKKIK